jgi:cob(I)alamin adenosyltransferase
MATMGMDVGLRCKRWSCLSVREDQADGQTGRECEARAFGPLTGLPLLEVAVLEREARFLARFPELVEIKALGEGFTWETQDRARDLAAAARAWEVASRMLADPGFAMVVLDELNVALRYDQLPLAPVLEALAARPPTQHAVVTGRNAPEALIEVADLVTEMTMVKHPFRAGIKAQKGVEF